MPVLCRLSPLGSRFGSGSEGFKILMLVPLRRAFKNMGAGSR